MSLDLDAIKQRAEAATEGPWHIENDSEQDYEVGIPYSEWPSVLVGPENAFPSEWAKGHGETRRVQEVPELLPSDAAFIAHARTDVPALVAEVERLQAVISAVVEFCSDFCTEGCCETCSGQNEAYQQVLDIIRESKKA